MCMGNLQNQPRRTQKQKNTRKTQSIPNVKNILHLGMPKTMINRDKP